MQQIQAAADQVGSLDILINNAGVFLPDDLSDRSALERHLAVNLFGTYQVTQAFLPLLIRSRGAIVNNVSLAALAPIPLTPAYSLSKAAAFNMTQLLRALLASRGVQVHAVLTGPVDTDMVRDLDIVKASPHSVAQGIFDAVEKGEEDIFPDPQSALPGRQLARRRGQGARTPERRAAASAARQLMSQHVSAPGGASTPPASCSPNEATPCRWTRSPSAPAWVSAPSTGTSPTSKRYARRSSAAGSRR